MKKKPRTALNRAGSVSGRARGAAPGAVGGVGIDMTEVARIRKIFGRHPAFLRRFFTPEEMRYCLEGRNKYERIAARFAAKEAVVKALDMKNLRLRDISISKTETGRPEAALAGARFKNTRIMLSLTHTAGCACAVAVALQGVQGDCPYLPASLKASGRIRTVPGFPDDETSKNHREIPSAAAASEEERVA